jgi:hypothetical protein
MTDSKESPGAYHVLLIGIDAYPRRPLYGAVNDIDAIQRLLLGPRVGLPASSIQRLASPHPGALHDTTVPEAPATLANIRAALRELATTKVGLHDRVVIHYSGHGARFDLPGRGRMFHHEALAPVDCDQGNWLFDHELNELLRGIADRTRSIAVILDACHSAGITRSASPAPSAGDWPSMLRGRCLTPDDIAAVPELPAPPVADVSKRSGFGVDDCHVVAACLDHETACESPGADRVPQGVLTRALVEAIDQLDGFDPRTAPWATLWHVLGDRVERANRAQHVWSSGGLARAVLAGPPVNGDAGLDVRALAPGRYHIGAGRLAGVTDKARLALYGDKPDRFPPLDSPEDHAARLPVALEVVSTEPTSAVAEGRQITLPSVVRARLVRAGIGEQLRVAVVPRDPALEAALARSGLLELTDEPSAQVCVRLAGGRWTLTDDVHLGTPDLPALVSVRIGAHGLVRDVLEHYTRYRMPLQIANRAVDLPFALRLDLLACPPHDLSGTAAQVADLPVIPMPWPNACDLPSGARVAFRIENTAMRTLRVTLVNCAASGKVQVLGDQAIEPHSAHVFWALTNIGQPFAMTPPPGSLRCIDRLVVIGRTALGRSLDFLRVDHGFLEHARDAVTTPPPEQWTATQLVIRTSTPGAPADL